MAEINALKHKPMYMEDYVKQLDSLLSAGNRRLLTNAGNVSHVQAIEKATAQYRKYQVQNLSPVEEAYLATVKEIEKQAKNKGKQS